MENQKLAEEMESVLAKLDQVADDDKEGLIAVLSEAAGETGSEELTEADLDDVSGGSLLEMKIYKYLLNNTKLGKLSKKGVKMCARAFYDYAKYGNAYKTYSKAEFEKMNVDLDEATPSWIKKLAK